MSTQNPQSSHLKSQAKKQKSTIQSSEENQQWKTDTITLNGETVTVSFPDNVRD